MSADWAEVKKVKPAIAIDGTIEFQAAEHFPVVNIGVDVRRAENMFSRR
jgi:hypothetical protein